MTPFSPSTSSDTHAPNGGKGLRAVGLQRQLNAFAYTCQRAEYHGSRRHFGRGELCESQTKISLSYTVVQSTVKG